MRQKYLIVPEKNSVIIKESSELDKGMFQQVGEITYDSNIVKIAKEGDVKELASALRSPSFYPSSDCATKLAETIVTIYKSANYDPVELAFSDIDQLSKGEDKVDEDDNDASVVIDELLDDNDDDDDLDGDDLLKDGNIKDISSSIKIADEDDLVDDDEV
jgi:hypothetical protein